MDIPTKIKAKCIQCKNFFEADSDENLDFCSEECKQEHDNKYKNLKEIVELSKEQIDNNDENVSAVLDLEDLKELKQVLEEIED